MHDRCVRGRPEHVEQFAWRVHAQEPRTVTALVERPPCKGHRVGSHGRERSRDSASKQDLTRGSLPSESR